MSFASTGITHCAICGGALRFGEFYICNNCKKENKENKEEKEKEEKMNKKIKAIDLLNKMANDESYRPTVKYQEVTYTYHNDIGDYTNDFNSEYGIFSGWALNLMLNNEVEILEDNTEEIEEIEEIKGWGLATDYKDFETINHTLDRFGNKINELVKAINELRKEKE